jgi:hypothetical protein
MDKHDRTTVGDRMPESERLAFIRNTAEKHSLSHKDLAFFTGYSQDSVGGWLSDTDSPRHRIVPARAVDRLMHELRSGLVKGSK